jgi:23S rRNA (uracil1939-C5)-methyltransferase
MKFAIPLPFTIQDVAFGGAGVARSEGKVVFIPFTIPGEEVVARIVKEKKSFAEAELFEVTVPSPDRVEPPCPYFGKCGGCAYQHISYPRELAIKQQQVEQTLRRVGKFETVPMQPIIPAPKDYGYRNRIRIHAASGKTGFYARGEHRIIDVAQCAIASPTVNTALRKLRNRPVRDGDYSLRAPGGGPFFEQTNPEVTRELLELVRRSVRTGQALLVDAYCGAGLFAKDLAGAFEQVVGIDNSENAIAHARRSTGENERYLHGDVAAHLGEVLASGEAARTTVLLDPPATGLEPHVIDQLLAGRPAEILYISCNPATLARDLALLAREYALESVTPIDMFPQTAEIEVVTRLALRDPK